MSRVRPDRALPRPAAVRARRPGRDARRRARRRSCTRPRSRERVGAEVWLKLEGANPTGSFKDRGMTCAVSAAVREGAKAVICASTGNTAASAAAYAARAGLRCAVIVPEGKIATGKLAQALMHGARVIALRGNFDQALTLVRELADRHPIALVNSVNAVPARGPEDRRVRDRSRSSGELDALCIPVGNAGNITAYWKGFREVGRGAADARLPGRGRGAARRGQAGRAPGDGRERDPHRQPGALGGGDGRDDRARAAPSRAVTDAQILDAYRFLAAREGVFCEPASAASVAGLLVHGAGGARARRLRAHRPRAQGPADRARPGRRGRAVRAGAGGRRAGGRYWRLEPMERRRLVRVPASSANLGPGFDVLAAALGAAPRARGASRPGAFAVETDLDVARDRATSCVRGFERLHPADGFTFRIALGDPALAAGSARAPRRSSPACWRPTTCSSSTPTCSALATRDRGPSRQRRRGAARRLRRLRRRRGRRASSRRPAWRRCSSSRTSRSAPPRRARRCPPRCRSPTPSSTSPTPRCSTLGLARGDWDLVARGLDDRLHQPHRAHLYPRSCELVARARASSARSARRSPAPARPCSSGATTSRPRSSPSACARGRGSWAEVLRVPFESQGADVRSL